MKRTARELARMIREAYPGASGVALDAADALDEACVEIARLRRRAADPYFAALDAWKKDGGARPVRRPDGIPTRADMQWMTAAELAIREAMQAVEAVGASVALTDAVTLLSKAQDRVADHVEGRWQND